MMEPSTTLGMLGRPLQLRLLLTLALTLLALMITFVVSYTIGRGGLDRVEREIGLSLAMLADQMQDKLDRGLFERAREITNMAEVLATREGAGDPQAIRRWLEQMQATFPDYAWIGIADAGGAIKVATHGLLQGESAAQEKWFRNAIRGDTVGDVHDAGRLSDKVPGLHGERLRFIDVAAAIRRQGQVVGVLGAHLNWSWAREVKDSLFGTIGANQRIEVLVMNRSGTVLLGPPEIVGQVVSLGIMHAATAGANRYAVETWPDRRAYLSGFAVSDGYRQFGGLGWSILVRQRAEEALEPVVALRRQTYGWSAAFVGLAGLLAWLLASRLTQPLLRLARTADEVRRGAPTEIPHVGVYAEAEMLSNSLRTLVADLKNREAKLSDLNVSLERQVADRTRKLAEAKEEAERATRSKSRFLAAASHDLRQPLHALTLFARALSRRVTGEEAKGLVAQTEQALASLKEMFDALLNVSRLDAGLIEPNVQDVPLLALIERLAPGFRAEAEHRGLRFEVRPLDAVIRTDPVLLETIVRNLLSNALKFTAQGGVLLACRQRGDRIALEVYDTGPGMEQSAVGRVFLEFERSAKTATGANDGLGLGLSIVLRYAQLLGLSIDVASRPGHGTRFRILVPAVMGAAARREPERLVSVSGDSLLQGRRILVLDDERLIVDSLTRDLTDRGAVVMPATSIAEAEALLASGPLPQVVVVDINLTSAETGPQFVDRMSRRIGRNLPALVLTGATDAETLGELVRGGRRWLTKPADPEMIATALGELLADADRAHRPLAAAQ